MDWSAEPVVEEKPAVSSFKFGAGIKPATAIPAKTNVVAGIFGTFGTGKSFWAFSAKRPVIIVDTERRAQNILMQMSDISDMHVFDVMDYATVKDGDLDYSGMLDKFRKDIVEFANERKKDEHKGTLVIDSMSDVVRWYAQWLDQQKNVKRDPDGSVSSFEKHKSREKLREFIDLLKMTGWNVIVTFKEKQLWEAGRPSENYMPEWDKELGYACDVLINLRQDGPDRKFLLHKNSFGSTAIDIRNVDWQGFLDKITASSGIKFA